MKVFWNVQFQKKTNYPPHGKALGIPRGWGCLKSQNFRSKVGSFTGISRGYGGGGCKTKRPSVVEYG